MEAFVTALTADVTATALWGAIAPAAPIVITGILLAFGYRVLGKSVRGISKGQGRV